MTEFRKLAERIAKDIEAPWYCCSDLPKIESEFFKEWFKPSENELKVYGHSEVVWMAEIDSDRSRGNNLRILALLFAEQLWNDIKEGENG